MERNLSLQELKSTISETTYDSESTASNSIIEEYMDNKLDGNNKQQPTNVNTIAISSSSNIQIGDSIVYNGPVMIKQEFSPKGNAFKDFKHKSLPESSEKTYKNIPKSDIKRWKIFIVMCLLIFMSLLLLKLIISLNYGANDVAKATETPIKLNELKIYSRADWGASEPDGKVNKLSLPLARVIINHTVMKNCYTKECCIQNMKQMDSLHMRLKYYSIGYNFVICNDGNIYEGIGWDYEGAHTLGQNPTSFGIAFNGNFNPEMPNKNQVAAFFSLLKLGVELGKLTPDYKIFGARQFVSTESPGEALYQMMQTWDHWSEKT